MINIQERKEIERLIGELLYYLPSEIEGAEESKEPISNLVMEWQKNEVMYESAIALREVIVSNYPNIDQSTDQRLKSCSYYSVALIKALAAKLINNKVLQ